MENPIYILGIESSGVISGISMSKDGKLITQQTQVAENMHSRLLAEMGKQVLVFSGVELSAISAIALSAGPGSFTGLRIGYSLAKGLAHPSSTPVIQVPTLEIYAYQNKPTNLAVLSIMDAHRNEIYCAKYVWNNGDLLQIKETHLQSLNHLKDLLKEPTIIVGKDIPDLRKNIIKICGEMAVFSNLSLPFPESWALQEIAFKRFQQGKLISATECQPLYIRAFKGVM